MPDNPKKVPDKPKKQPDNIPADLYFIMSIVVSIDLSCRGGWPGQGVLENPSGWQTLCLCHCLKISF